MSDVILEQKNLWPDLSSSSTRGSRRRLPGIHLGDDGRRGVGRGLSEGEAGGGVAWEACGTGDAAIDLPLLQVLGEHIIQMHHNWRVQT